ncbi:MAG: aspartate aminotransferase family protein [Thermoanaerobaculia bacterium]
MARLKRGDLPPQMLARPPGRRSRALSRRLERSEAPGVNTLQGGEPAVVWAQALGVNVLDVDGNRYLDFTSGFGASAVGHRHPDVVAAVRRQSAALLHGLGDVAAHPARVDLAEELVGRAPLPDARVHFAISGADAVEVALKTARLATGRPGVVAFAPAYHGTTLGALAAGSREAFRAPFADWLNPHVARLAFGCDAGALERALAGGHVAAVLVEPIVGREGVHIPPAGWLTAVAEICRRHGTLLIADEILTGCGRTGTFFAVDHEGIEPDLLCCGKALGGGMPIAAVLGGRDLMAAWDPGDDGEALHTATFLAHPLACAAALATLAVLTRDRLDERAGRLGERLALLLASWPRRLPGVVAVRGRGLLWGVELDSAARAGGVRRQARDRGLLLLGSGPVLELCPPLTISEELLLLGCDLLSESLTAAN